MSVFIMCLRIFQNCTYIYVYIYIFTCMHVCEFLSTLVSMCLPKCLCLSCCTPDFVSPVCMHVQKLQEALPVQARRMRTLRPAIEKFCFVCVYFLT